MLPGYKFGLFLERIWLKPDAVKILGAGRKPVAVVLLFKVLFLIAIYNLPDEQNDYQVLNRLSCIRFFGLGLG